MKNILLRPLSWLYGLIISIRNFFYDYKIFKSEEFKIPVISIGNITVGGTGKTPHTEYLIKLLKKEFEVATLSRGYKRKSKGFQYVETTSTAAHAGDEPLQIKCKFPDITVAVDADRVQGIKHILSGNDNNSQPDAILLDDAYQHRSVKPGINILLIDYNRPITKDHILPYGRLRENAKGRSRANIIIITKCPSLIQPINERIIHKELAIKPYQNLYFTTFNYGKLTPYFNVEDSKNEINWEKQKPTVLLVTAIASPKLLGNYLNTKARKIIEMTYSDHHYFTKNDLQNIKEKFEHIESEEKIIVTTEKDMVKLKDMDLPEVLQKNLYYIPLEVSFLNNKQNEFNKKILNYIKENRSNLRLQSKNKI